MKGLVLTYLLTYGGAALAVFNPFVGVCVLWLLDIVRPQYMFAWAGVQGDLSDVVAIATIIGWALKRFGNWSLARGRLIFAFYIAHGLWVLISAFLAPDQDVALGFVTEQLKRTIIFTIAVTTADSLRRVEQLAWVITGSAGYLAFELNLRYLDGTNEAHSFGYGGMDNNCLAISMVTCLGVAAFLGFHARAWWQKTAALGAAALISHTVLLTFSRGGMLGMIVVGAMAIAIIPKRPRYFFPVVAAGLIVLSFAGPEVRTRFSTSFEEEHDSSAQSRVDLWLDCIEVMRAYPVFGAGPDHFPLIVEEFGWPPGKEAHSLWLQLGAEIGIVGALFLLLFYLVAMWRMWPLARGSSATETQRWVRHAACMVVTSLAGFVVSVQFVTLEGLEAPLYVTAIAIGTLRLETQAQLSSQPAPATTRTATIKSLPMRVNRVRRGARPV